MLLLHLTTQLQVLIMTWDMPRSFSLALPQCVKLDENNDTGEGGGVYFLLLNGIVSAIEAFHAKLCLIKYRTGQSFLNETELFKN